MATEYFEEYAKQPSFVERLFRALGYDPDKKASTDEAVTKVPEVIISRRVPVPAQYPGGNQTRGVERFAPPAAKARETSSPIRGLSGGRVSQENPDQYFTGLETMAVFSSRSYWQKFLTVDKVNLHELQKMDVNALAELLADLSPEVSDALWKFLLMCNAGYETRVLQPGTDEPFDEGQAIVDAWLEQLARYNGTLDVFYNRMFMTVALRGSTLGELILDEAGREFVDIATPDTRTLKYRRVVDEKRGQTWDFGQMQQGTFVSLNIETVRYAPLHPFPNSIEGRPLFGSAFFLAIFLMAVLRDFKRVIQQQGYPRLDVEIDFEKIKDSMPAEAVGNPEEFEKWVNGIVDQVINVYKKLEPDDTYVHTNVTTVNNPVGAINTNSLSAMDGLFKALERMAARALHTMPLLMGITDGVSEANANRQWEIYAKGIESVQHLVENVVGPLLELALQARGIVAKVELRFEQMRAAEKLRDAQVEFLQTQTAVIQRNEGFISQDQAAAKCAGVKEAFSETPVYPTQTGGNPDTQGTSGIGTGEQNDNRRRMQQIFELPPERRARLLSTVDAMLRAPTFGEVSAMAEIWRTHAPEDAVALLNAQPASEAAN